MMKKIKKSILVLIISLSAVGTPVPARADMFGGDVAVLVQILANALKQLAELKAILSTGEDTLSLLREINQGIRNGLTVIQILNPNFNPGVLGNMEDINQLLGVVTQLYGQIPQTADGRMQSVHDQSVAESLSMNTRLYKYADQVDVEKDRIIAHSQVVNPQGAAKLQNQSLAVLIGVTTQLLRTNSAMLKLMAENMALQNRKAKLSSEQFKAQYDGLSKALGSLPPDPKLPTP